jgi:O-antigen chain-terminating methyltransferase
MTDIDKLLERLRAAAAEHVSPQAPTSVTVRSWPPAADVGARRALIDAWTSSRPAGLGPFLVPDSAGFVDLAYAACLGRRADPAGRSHYLRRLQQGAPRLEILVDLATSPEGERFGGGPNLPLWLRPMAWALRGQRPARRAVRAAMRRIESRLGERARRDALGLLWRLSAAIDDNDHFHRGEREALGREVATTKESASSALNQSAAARSLSAEVATRVEQFSAETYASTRAMAAKVAQLSAESDASTKAMAAKVEELSTKTDASTRAVEAKVAQFSAESDASTKAVEAMFAAKVAQLSADTDTSTKAIAAMRARMAALEYATDLPATAAPSPATPVGDALTRYYLTLESKFRGDPARVRAQFENDYLDFVRAARDDAGDAPCIDVGCGRGEWLEVLRDHGFSARGVDSNPVMAAQGSASGHTVIVDDAVAYLRSQPADSALAISAFHLVEHLDFPTLFRLIAECRRVLKPRGLLLLETPNPENIWVATHTFHHDPTHGNPLTPESLEFLVNHHGLETLAVQRLHPIRKRRGFPATTRSPSA